MSYIIIPLFTLQHALLRDTLLNTVSIAIAVLTIPNFKVINYYVCLSVYIYKCVK